MSILRQLNYSYQSNGALSNNGRFQFSRRFALEFYVPEAIYTFIPKNACSTMRYSLAIQNSCLPIGGDVNWIHANNATFIASLASLIKAKYTFVILRCPFRRLISAFLNKFLERSPDSWQYYESINRHKKVDDLTFRDFVYSLKDLNLIKLNIHWRPQTDFLVYKHYDDYFQLEEFGAIKDQLQSKIDLGIIDTRDLLNHDIGHMAIADYENSSNLSVLDLMNMKKKGALPTYGSFYTDDLYRIVKSLYKSDVSLYMQKFGDNHLLKI